MPTGFDASDAAIAAKRAARRRMMADSAGELTPIPGVPTLARLSGYTHQLDYMTRKNLKDASLPDTDVRAAIKRGLYRGEEYVLRFRIEDSASALDGRVVTIRCRIPDLDEKKSSGKSAFRPGAADMLKFFTAILPSGEPVEDEDQWDDWLAGIVEAKYLLNLTFKLDQDKNPKTGKVYPFSRIEHVYVVQEVSDAGAEGEAQAEADEAYAAGEAESAPAPEAELEPEPEPAPAPAPKVAARKPATPRK